MPTARAGGAHFGNGPLIEAGACPELSAALHAAAAPRPGDGPEPSVDVGVGARVMAALRPFLQREALLAPQHCLGDPQAYRRHLLCACPRGTYTALALVWEPGQASPVHGHSAWCAVGVVRGVATEARFSMDDAGRPRATPDGVLRHEAGAALLSRPGDAGVHVVRNDEADTLLTIHVYGLDLREDPAAINLFYDG